MERGRQAYEALGRGASHEAMVCCAAYLLGEYGKQLQEATPRQLFQTLHERFPTLSNEGKVCPSPPEPGFDPRPVPSFSAPFLHCFVIFPTL